MSETDNFSHRAGYHADPLAVAMRQARKGGTLGAGWGELLVKEIDRLTARAERAEAVLARLREPSHAVMLAGHLAPSSSITGYWAEALAAAVETAEREVNALPSSPVEPTATDVLFPGVRT